MATLERRTACLGGLAGRGYLFVRRTYMGKEVIGRFFAEAVDEACAARLLNADRAFFEGTLFEGEQEEPIALRVNVVNVVNVSDVYAGKRFDLEQV